VLGPIWTFHNLDLLEIGRIASNEDGTLKLRSAEALVADGILILLFDIVDDVSNLLCRIDRFRTHEELIRQSRLFSLVIFRVDVQNYGIALWSDIYQVD
jgi:hypothetical protein